MIQSVQLLLEQPLRDGERTKATGYEVEREESMNRDREPAQERPRKAKDGTGNREEFKNQAQGVRQREGQK